MSVTQADYPTGNVGYQNGFFFIDVDFGKYSIGDKVTLSFDYIVDEIHSISTLTTIYAGKNGNSITPSLSSGDWKISGRLTAVITVIADMNPYVEVRLCGNSITVTNIMLNEGSTALPYEPYGIKIPISNGGENLFDGNYVNAYLTSTGMYNYPDNTTKSIIVKCDPNTTYTIKQITDTETRHKWRIAVFNSMPTNNAQGTIIVNDDSLSESTITTLNDSVCIVVYYMYPTPLSNAEFMINLGSKALPYEPYNRTTTPTYLGEVETTRRVKKLVLTGEENVSVTSTGMVVIVLSTPPVVGKECICSHYIGTNVTSYSAIGEGECTTSIVASGGGNRLVINDVNLSTADAYKAFFSQQYAAGTPVCVWYVPTTEETAVVNEPLMKIGEYADELSIDTNIPLTQNTKNIINIDTTLKPSSASFTYNKKGTYIGYNKINVNVSNTYTAEDDGKVVNNAALVSQTAMPAEITVNNTYDTTLYNSIVVNVPPAPTPTPSVKSGVVFYDYDGTIVQSYSANDFANLSELPANPIHEGLTAQGWNWSLADAKAHVANYGSLNIGQQYVTDNGKTRIYINLPEGRISPLMMLYLNDNTELDIDWGDGSTHSTWTTTSADYKSERHSYPDKGKYVIAITVVSGSFIFKSSSTSYNTFFTDGKNNSNSSDRAYLNSIQKIEIGTGVTSIGNYAFYNCSSLSSVTIPDTVTTIGSSTFQYCYALYSINIPNNVTSIQNYTFYNCYSLSSTTIPNNVTSIGSSIFYGCRSLSSINIPNNVTSIGSNTFDGCPSLSSVTIGDSVTTIGNSAFSNCPSLSSVTIPDTVTTIGSSAFSACHVLSSVTIPDSVTSIGSSAFSSCSSLSSVTIGDSVITIGSSAFQHCYSLSSVTIPDSVTTIQSNTFQYCYVLSSVTIPDSVTSIGSGAFQYCSSLSSVTIPDSVTTIQSNAFSNCNSMDYIRFLGTTPPTVQSSNAWTSVSKSTILYTPALVSNLYMDGTNYPAKATYTYIGYATYASGETLPSTTTDETYTLTWYATSADAIAQINPITQGTGNEVYSRATPVV